MQIILNHLQKTFSSLGIKNYRLYFIGQAISLSGNWMQTVGLAWLVLELTHSGTILGLVIAAQFLPILFFAPIGGVITDRLPKRNILYVTQALMGIVALTLGLLVASGAVQLWMVFVIAICIGLVNSVDNPTRQTFALEMVGHENLANAITLNSSEINLARVIGPAIAGVLISTIGLAPCFIINGLSFGALLIVLKLMDSAALQASPRVGQVKGQLTEGFKYILHTPKLRDTLIMLAIVGTLAYEFQVSLPIIARITFHGTAGTYAWLTGAMGLGAVVGGLSTAHLKKSGPHMLIIMACVFGIAILLAAIMPTLPLAIVAMVVVGVFSITFTTLGNVILQLESTPEMRGRVMSLWTVAFLGSTPIGGPIVGFIGENAGPRWGLAIGGVAAIAAAAFGWWTLHRQKDEPITEDILLESEEAENVESIRIR